MSEPTTIRARRPDDGTIVQELDDGTFCRLESRTDWDRLAAMTEEEIEANALADEDNPPITAAELARMKPVPNSREIRQRLDTTQQQFSRRHLIKD